MGDKDIYDPHSLDKQYLDSKLSESKANARNVIWTPTFNLEYNDWVFYAARTISDVQTFKPIGILVVNVLSSYLNSLIDESNLGRSAALYLIDEQAQIVSCKNRARIGTAFDEEYLADILANQKGNLYVHDKGVNQFVVWNVSRNTGWKVVSIVPVNELNTQIISSQSILVPIGIFGLLISLIISNLIASKITSPLSRMIGAMKQVEQGNLNVPLDDNTFYETLNLSRSFSIMQKKLKELMAKNLEKEKIKNEAEFRALQAQINPHFLYNTLDIINCMLLVEGRDDVSKIVTCLSDIIRYNTEKVGDMISLREERELLEKYLYIQKMRYGDRLDYICEFSEDMLDCQVLKFLLQPILENALNHGIESKRGKGIVEVTGYIEDDHLLIQIRDNGVGIPHDKIPMLINDDYIPRAEKKRASIGVNNVHKRIKLFYGDQYGLEIHSVEGEGTDIRLTMPINRIAASSSDTHHVGMYDI